VIIYSMSKQSLTARSYFRTPALAPNGKQVAFVYAADIWLVDLEGGAAQRLTAHPSLNSSPRFSPSGKELAFTSTRTGNGDIYILPLESGDVRQITFHDSPATMEAWSADGQQLYFSSSIAQLGMGIYRVSAMGGTPSGLINEPFEDLVHATVSPDGSQIAFNLVRMAWWRKGPNPYAASEIWTLSLNCSEGEEPRLPRRQTTMKCINRWPLWASDGKGFYFVSDRNGYENIWYSELQSEESRQITNFRDGRVLWPTIAPTSETIVFERDFDLWRLDLKSGESEPISIKVGADTRITPVRVESYIRANELSLAPDGKKIAYVARGEVFADFADKETDREQRQGASFRITNTPAREKDVVWSPDSRSLVYISDRYGEDELISYSFLDNSEKRLTDDPSPKSQPCFSPDGKWIAYMRGIDQIYLLNTETREVRPFAQGLFIRTSGLAWSPDSRWLAFLSNDEHLFTNVYVQRIDETQARQVTFLSNLEGYGLLWSPNGRFLIFTSGQYRAEAQIARVDLRPAPPQFRETEFEKLFEDRRSNGAPQLPPAPAVPAPPPITPAELIEQTETPSERSDPAAPKEAEKPSAPAQEEPRGNKVEIIFEGIERRLRLITPEQMDGMAHAISPDNRDLLFTARVADKMNIWSLPLDELRQDQPPRQLTYTTSYKGSLQFSPDGKLFYYLDEGRVTTRKFPNGNDPTTVAIRGDIVVDFNQEKQQMFAETWRLMRDHFYDESFRGLDWNTIRDYYAPAVAGAQISSDLYAILNLMLGDLRASHMGVWPTGSGGNQDGYTGLIFDRVELIQTGALRIANIVPDSPATRGSDDQIGSGDAPRIGEFLIAVNGVQITKQTNLFALLQRTVGRRVVLSLSNNADGSDSREVAIRPINAYQYERLLYRTWTATNERYVHRISNGRIGYVHIEEMSYPAYQQFLIDLNTEARGKEGVVIDVRYNGGGHTATFILDVLSRSSTLRSGFRNRTNTDVGHYAGNRVLNKPTVLVTNEKSASNTEMFSESYRRKGLGPIVGKPTAGAVIWTSQLRLIDGSILRLPHSSTVTPEGEDLEGTGRPVDVEIDRSLGEWALGIDKQLDAAVEALLARLATNT
jgi:tricorn protease